MGTILRLKSPWKNLTKTAYHPPSIITLIFLILITANPIRADVDKSGVKPQVISLPKGPGSIEGLGDSFEPQLNSGTTTYSIKLAVQQGITGFQPELTLRYNGGSPNSPFGLGWSLSVGHIQRQIDKGFPQYNDMDTFIESSGEELVPVGEGKYRCENEGSFMQYERTEEGWIARSKSGIFYRYGTDSYSQISENGKIFRWLLQQMQDTNGNTISFIYSDLNDGSQRYLSEIQYNGHTIKLEYEERPDKLTDYRSTIALPTSFRCRSISMVTDSKLVRRYDLSYDPAAHVSLLHSVTHIGRNGTSALPPAVLTYTAFDADNFRVTAMEGEDEEYPPFIIMSSEPDVTLNDMNADALPDILVAKSGEHHIYLNAGMDSHGKHRWRKRQDMTQENPGEALGNDGASLADIDGDGKTDFIAKYPTNETFFLWRNLGNGQWDTVRDFGSESVLPFDFENPTVRLLDVNNDKYIDVMYCNDASGETYSYFINNKGEKYDSVIAKEGLGNAMTFDQRPGMKLADMNGDRLQDIVLMEDGLCRYWPSKGVGEWGDPVDMDTPLKNGELSAEHIIYHWTSIMLLDFNGDGLTDLVYVPEGDDELIFWLNKNSRAFAPPAIIKNLPARLADTTVQPADMNGNGTVDILWNYPEDSDIHREKVWQYVDFSPHEKPNLLKTVTNGTGRTITFHYTTTSQESLRDRETDPWPENVPTTVTVLSAFDVEDGRGNQYTTQMTYHEGYYDGTEKEFRGFARAVKREIGDATIPDLIMDYQFFTGINTEALKGKPRQLEIKNSAGELFHRETYQWETREIAGESTQGSGQARRVIFAYQSAREKTITEKGNGTPVTLKWEYAYDNYGNQTRKVEHGRLDENWDDERVTQTSYTANYPSGTSLWILDRVVQQDIMDEQGNYSSRKTNYYDNSLTAGEVLKGNLTRTNEWVSGDDYIITSRNDYDSYGNVTAIYDPLYGTDPGHYREIVYDDIYHTFPIQEKIHTGTTTLTLSAQYDPGFGVITSSTDFNGHTTTYNHDTFARLTAMTKPPDQSPTVEYDYILAHDMGNGKIINWVETRQRDDHFGEAPLDNGFLYSTTFYDGLGRKIMTRAEGEAPGQVVVTDTIQFNARKAPWKKYLPYFEQASTLDFVEPSFNTGYTEHIYDAQGREIRTYQPVGPEGRLYSSTTYTPLAKTVQDEEQTRPDSIHSGCGMRYIEDGLQDKDGNGRLRQVFEIVKISDIGEPLNQPVEWKTSYTYDLLNNLTGYTDSQNNQKIIAYDALSRKTFMNDPDRGHMKYWYDNAGNLIKTKDAKNQVITYKYDGVNRLTAEYYGTVDSSPPDVAYHYDFPRDNIPFKGDQGTSLAKTIADAVLSGNSHSEFDLNHDNKIDVADVVTAAKNTSESTPGNIAENTLGYLSWVEDQSGEEYNSYDQRGRVKSVIKKIHSNTEGLRSFQTSMAYDTMDRVTELTYPDSSKVAYQYNSRGLLESVPDVITGYNYNPAGQNARLSLACGTDTTYDYDHRLRLSRLYTVRQMDTANLQDLSYTYDGVSNITQITDSRDDADYSAIAEDLGITLPEAAKSNATQSFIYDSLYRLTSASNPEVYGSIGYRYDRIGNMVLKNSQLIEQDPAMDLGVMTSGGVAGTYGRIGREPGDQPGPHAITGTEKGPEGAMQFTYDANGNMTTNRDKTLFWDFKDRLTGLERGNTSASYLYDYTDIRKRKVVISDNGTTEEVIYIDKFSEVRDALLVKYLYAGNSRIARQKGETSASGSVKPDCFFLQDHLGSTNVTLSESGTVAEKMVNYPFGKQRISRKSSSSVCNADYQFTGKELDTESDLMYFEARYYDPVIGKFVSFDPILFDSSRSKLLLVPQKLNAYSYAYNSPINIIDPSGKAGMIVTAMSWIKGETERHTRESALTDEYMKLSQLKTKVNGERIYNDNLIDSNELVGCNINTRSCVNDAQGKVDLQKRVGYLKSVGDAIDRRITKVGNELSDIPKERLQKVGESLGTSALGKVSTYYSLGELMENNSPQNQTGFEPDPSRPGMFTNNATDEILNTFDMADIEIIDTYSSEK